MSKSLYKALILIKNPDTYNQIGPEQEVPTLDDNTETIIRHASSESQMGWISHNHMKNKFGMQPWEYDILRIDLLRE